MNDLWGPQNGCKIMNTHIPEYCKCSLCWDYMYEPGFFLWSYILFGMQTFYQKEKLLALGDL